MAYPLLPDIAMNNEAHYERACRLLLLVGAAIHWAGVAIFLSTRGERVVEATDGWASTLIGLALQTLG